MLTVHRPIDDEREDHNLDETATTTTTIDRADHPPQRRPSTAYSSTASTAVGASTETFAGPSMSSSTRASTVSLASSTRSTISDDSVKEERPKRSRFGGIITDMPTSRNVSVSRRTSGASTASRRTLASTGSAPRPAPAIKRVSTGASASQRSTTTTQATKRTPTGSASSLTSATKAATEPKREVCRKASLEAVVTTRPTVTGRFTGGTKANTTKANSSSSKNNNTNTSSTGLAGRVSATPATTSTNTGSQKSPSVTSRPSTESSTSTRSTVRMVGRGNASIKRRSTETTDSAQRSTPRNSTDSPSSGRASNETVRNGPANAPVTRRASQLSVASHRVPRRVSNSGAQSATADTPAAATAASRAPAAAPSTAEKGKSLSTATSSSSMQKTPSGRSTISARSIPPPPRTPRPTTTSLLRAARAAAAASGSPARPAAPARLPPPSTRTTIFGGPVTSGLPPKRTPSTATLSTRTPPATVKRKSTVATGAGLVGQKQPKPKHSNTFTTTPSSMSTRSSTSTKSRTRPVPAAPLMSARSPSGRSGRSIAAPGRATRVQPSQTSSSSAANHTLPRSPSLLSTSVLHPTRRRPPHLNLSTPSSSGQRLTGESSAGNMPTTPASVGGLQSLDSPDFERVALVFGWRDDARDEEEEEEEAEDSYLDTSSAHPSLRSSRAVSRATSPVISPPTSPLATNSTTGPASPSVSNDRWRWARTLTKSQLFERERTAPTAHPSLPDLNSAATAAAAAVPAPESVASHGTVPRTPRRHQRQLSVSVVQYDALAVIPPAPLVLAPPVPPIPAQYRIRPIPSLEDDQLRLNPALFERLHDRDIVWLHTEDQPGHSNSHKRLGILARSASLSDLTTRRPHSTGSLPVSSALLDRDTPATSSGSFSSGHGSAGPLAPGLLTYGIDTTATSLASWQTGQIAAATPEMMVVLLTTRLDYAFLADFLLTYRAFMSPMLLCQLLVARFQWTLIDQHAGCGHETSSNTNGEADVMRRVVRVRLYVVLRHWLLEHYATDFQRDRAVRRHLVRFLDTLASHPVMKQSARDQRIAQQLKRVMRRLRRYHARRPRNAIHTGDIVLLDSLNGTGSGVNCLTVIQPSMPHEASTTIGPRRRPHLYSFSTTPNSLAALPDESVEVDTPLLHSEVVRIPRLATPPPQQRHRYVYAGTFLLPPLACKPLPPLPLKPLPPLPNSNKPLPPLPSNPRTVRRTRMVHQPLRPHTFPKRRTLRQRRAVIVDAQESGVWRKTLTTALLGEVARVRRGVVGSVKTKLQRQRAHVADVELCTCRWAGAGNNADRPQDNEQPTSDAASIDDVKDGGSIQSAPDVLPAELDDTSVAELDDELPFELADPMQSDDGSYEDVSEGSINEDGQDGDQEVEYQAGEGGPATAHPAHGSASSRMWGSLRGSLRRLKRPSTCTDCGCLVPMRSVAAIRRMLADSMTEDEDAGFLLGYRSEAVAITCCAIEADVLRSIDWHELLKVDWNRPVAKDSERRGVRRLIDRFNQFTQWVVSEIVSVRQTERRARLIEKYIRVALKCYWYGNYTTVLQILLGLQSPAVERLQQTWARVDTYERRVLSELQLLSNPGRNWAVLRRTMEQYMDQMLAIVNEDEQGGCVPFLGIYLSDLVYNAELPAYVDHYLQAVAEGLSCNRFSQPDILESDLYAIERSGSIPSPCTTASNATTNTSSQSYGQSVSTSTSTSSHATSADTHASKERSPSNRTFTRSHTRTTSIGGQSIALGVAAMLIVNRTPGKRRASIGSVLESSSVYRMLAATGDESADNDHRDKEAARAHDPTHHASPALVNYQRHRTTASIVRRLRQYQQLASRYSNCLEVDPLLRQRLMQLSCLDNPTVQALSREREPPMPRH